jgi:hypothetical protein
MVIGNDLRLLFHQFDASSITIVILSFPEYDSQPILKAIERSVALVCKEYTRETTTIGNLVPPSGYCSFITNVSNPFQVHPPKHKNMLHIKI